MEIAIDALYIPFFIGLASFVAILSLFIRKTRIDSDENIQIPPSPPALPIIGHLHLLSSKLHISLNNLASRYGPFMLIRSGGATLYVVSNGAMAKQIFKVHDIKFAARSELTSKEHLIYHDTEFSVLDYGKKWAFLKKVCMMEFFSSRQLNRFSDVRIEELMKLLQVLMKKSEHQEACDVGVEFLAMTNNSLTRIMMSSSCSDIRNEVAELREITNELALASGLDSLAASFSLLKKYDLFGVGRKIKSLLMRFDMIMDGIILKYEGMNQRGGKERQDIMDILLNISKDPTAEVKITNMEIKGLFLDLFVGGSDTTRIALQWALAELLNRSVSLKKLQHEIDAIVGLNRLVQQSDVSNLPYLQAVVKETLRLHPSLPLVFRKCREDCKINDYFIAKNSTMLVNLYAINRDPNAWEDATDFIPERFLANPIDETALNDTEDIKGQNFSYVPFGGGRRRCPGSGHAMATLHSSLAALVQCFDWKIKGGQKVNMEEGEGFSTPMAHPLICYPILRVNPSILQFVH